MLSLLNTIDSSLRTFFNQLTESLGFGGYLGIVLGIEALFILLFVIKTIFSYEARLKRSLDKANRWLFQNKKIDTNNIKEFNNIVKKGPKRLVYYWQQFILFRDGGPSAYLNEDNLITKPLKTSSWVNNIKNLGLLTAIWTVVALILGVASQVSQQFGFLSISVALFLPCLVALIGVIAVIVLKGVRVLNLDDIYHIHHIFVRFLTNACVDLTPYLDFNLLFTEKELENGNPQLREYYEARARRVKEEFEKAQQNEQTFEEYKFEDVGVDGTLLLNRAMKESEIYINKKTATLSEIAQIEAQKDALRRNYENVQMDLQRKIQTSKENIQKLIEQQAATTSRIEVGMLRQKQENESNKKAGFQKDYDQEEKQYLNSKKELDSEIEELKKTLDESLEDAQKGMSAEYQSFFEKVMKSAYQVAEQRVKDEKNSIISEKDKNEQELINVQTQIKRLKDENDTLRDRLAKFDPSYMTEEPATEEEGHYDEYGNYIYADGSYHDTNGLFHDVDGKVYNMNGELVSEDLSPEEQAEANQEAIKQDQINSFGGYVDGDDVVSVAQSEDNETADEEAPVEEPTTEETEEVADEEPTEEQPEEVVEEPAEPEEPVSADEIPDEETPEVAIDEIPDEEPTEEQPKIKETAQTKEPVESVTEETTEEVETPQEEKAEDQPKKKRGRPRKETSTTEAVATQPKKRGRPRKTTTQETEGPKRRGRPPKSAEEKAESAKPASKTTAKKPTTTKSTTKKPASKTTAKKSTAKSTKKPTTKKTTTTSATAPKKRGRPRKTTTEPVETTPKRRGRPPKNASLSTTESNSFLDKINELINQEENKLKNMKAFLNSEINQALEPEDKDNISQEKDDIMSAVESLKEQANKAKSNGQSEELSKINKRIEDLIKELSDINSTDETDEGNAQ